MEEQRTLTLDFVKSLMEPSYTLVWTDYNDNLDNHLDIIRKCLDRRNCDCLWEKAGEWYGDAEYEAVHGIMEKLKEECFVFNDFDEHEVDAFFDEHEDAIRDEIYSRNDSDVVKDLIRYTDDIPIRVEMLSDYDCINSNWFESQGGYSYEASYFGDMVDSLNLNPAQVKKLLTSHGYKVYGRFPNRKSRNGKEQVSYEQFYEELINSCCGANLLTYIGKVSLKELYDADFSLKEVIIPKGNCCGLFSSTYGGGSLLEMELKQDVKLKLEVKGCNGFRFRLDDERSKYDYSIQHVYGVDDSFFNNAVSIVS
ncbi:MULTISPECIES: hypothetical protein [Bacteroidales]|uniref:Uncharacterized protein n=1 Tax=Phocaeicola dorei TaxID=357276 RepID=A0A5M5ZRY6_9BACT|nr:MULTISPECIES: hypothetical protein [Bacteroidales]KAA5381514.1 hypothetical protein F2Y61_14900 [Phocaeicola dorei]MDB9152151.1 hypothetical protein [Parabacteroides distasonis]MDB9156707.1 hypothetical protein [Parabacteroides distasonis]MDB9165832.1 hypothetical protein [Parabacteroides distasonis]MDB9170239.1 hypothetical protein [Parabacteroides distasonis]